MAGDGEGVELERWRSGRATRDGREGRDVTSGAESPLVRVARGDEGAVAACVDGYGPLVQGLVRRLLPASADYDDAVQEVFVELWRSAP